eukprot:2800122-Rhodomonas_salina.1
MPPERVGPEQLGPAMVGVRAWPEAEDRGRMARGVGEKAVVEVEDEGRAAREEQAGLRRRQSPQQASVAWPRLCPRSAGQKLPQGVCKLLCAGPALCSCSRAVCRVPCVTGCVEGRAKEDRVVHVRCCLVEGRSCRRKDRDSCMESRQRAASPATAACDREQRDVSHRPQPANL